MQTEKIYRCISRDHERTRQRRPGDGVDRTDQPELDFDRPGEQVLNLVGRRGVCADLAHVDIFIALVNLDALDRHIGVGVGLRIAEMPAAIFILVAEQLFCRDRLRKGAAKQHASQYPQSP